MVFNLLRKRPDPVLLKDYRDMTLRELAEALQMLDRVANLHAGTGIAETSRLGAIEMREALHETANPISHFG